jgi:hypothetical protein
MLVLDRGEISTTGNPDKYVSAEEMCSEGFGITDIFLWVR